MWKSLFFICFLQKNTPIFVSKIRILPLFLRSIGLAYARRGRNILLSGADIAQYYFSPKKTGTSYFLYFRPIVLCKMPERGGVRRFCRKEVE
jgi:hypothetical protein